MTPTSCLALGCALAATIAASACGAQPRPVALPARPFLVVANQRSGVATLVEIESGRVSHSDLDAKPHEVAVSPDSRVAVLTIPSGGLGAGRNVIVMDLRTAGTPRKIELRDIREPHGVQFLSDSVALIGALSGTSAAWVDVRNGRVLRSVGGLPANPYIIKSTATGRAYISSPHSSKVSEVEVAAGRVLRTLDIPDDPAGIAVSADGRELYAAVWREGAGGGIAIVDLATGTVATRLPATQPRRITVTPNEKFVVVSDRGHVHIVDRASRAVRSIAVGQDAGGSGVACSSDSARCYVALSGAGEIVEVDVNAARVLRRFAAQPGVDGIAYVPR